MGIAIGLGLGSALAFCLPPRGTSHQMIGSLVTTADQRRGGDDQRLEGDEPLVRPQKKTAGCCGGKTRDEISVESVVELAHAGDIILFDTRGSEQNWKYL